MFRDVARKKQALTRAECIALLKREKRAVLSVVTEHGYPYAVPVNHWYNEADGKLYFHGGKIVFRFGKCRSGDDPDLVFVIGNEADGNNLLIRLRQGVAGGIEHIFRAPSLDAEGVAAVRHGFALVPVAEVASDNYGQFGFCAGFGCDDDPAGRGTVCARIAERVEHIEIVRFRRRDGDFLFENSVRVAGR